MYPYKKVKKFITRAHRQTPTVASFARDDAAFELPDRSSAIARVSASLARANSVRRVVGRTRCGVSFEPEATRGARCARLNRRGDTGGDIGGEVRTVLSSINQCVGVFLHACGVAVAAGIYFKLSSRIWASSAATRVSVEIRSRWT